MIALTLVLFWLIIYLLIGWWLAVRRLPRAWVRARRSWGRDEELRSFYDDEIRHDVKTETVKWLLFWPSYGAYRLSAHSFLAISRHLDRAIETRDPLREARMLRDRDQADLRQADELSDP